MNYSTSPTNTTTTLLHGLCFLLSLPSEHLECITDPESDGGGTHCIYCSRGSGFSTGEGFDDYWGRGHVTLVLINSFTAVIGILGALMSCFIVEVLRRQKSQRSFDILLTALGWFDMGCCIICFLFVLSITCWFQNWSRHVVVLYGTSLGVNGSILAKSCSSLITLIIAVERYVAIAFPFTARRWFTPLKARCLVAFICVFAVLNGAARFGSTYIASNRVHRGIVSTGSLDYLIYPSKMEYLFMPFEFIDVFFPIPILLFFNIMIFLSIRKVSSNRKELTSSQRKELSAGKMILPVVAVLICCSFVPIAALLMYLGKAPIEILMFIFSLYTLNSAVNLPIYYWNSPGFRAEAKVVLAEWVDWMERRLGRKKVFDVVDNSNSGVYSITPVTSVDENGMDKGTYNPFRQSVIPEKWST